MGFTVTRVPIAQAATTSAPSPSPDASPSTEPAGSPEPAATPAPTPSPTPAPPTITPPAGWKQKATSLTVAGFKANLLWADPKGGAAIVAGYFTLPGVAAQDLDTVATLIHDGIAAEAGQENVTPAKRIKICGGEQDGVFLNVTLGKIREEIAIGISDRPYVAEYVRGVDAPEDPAAVRSILSLCAP
jgi:hypothetical protein